MDHHMDHMDLFLFIRQVCVPFQFCQVDSVSAIIAQIPDLFLVSWPAEKKLNEKQVFFWFVLKHALKHAKTLDVEKMKRNSYDEFCLLSQGISQNEQSGNRVGARLILPASLQCWVWWPWREHN